MRPAVVFLLSAFAATGVSGGSLYREKEEAIEAIERKYQDVENYVVNALENIGTERNKREEKAEEDTRREAEDKTQKTLKDFSGDVVTVTRSAIAKGKPLSCIDCMYKTLVDGRDAIMEIAPSFQKAVGDLRKTKKEVLDLAENEIILIEVAMKALKDESIKNINEAKTGFQSLKNDGLKKLDSAKKQLDEIERRIPKPVLLNELLNMKQKVAPKFNEVRQTYNKKLQHCLNRKRKI